MVFFRADWCPTCVHTEKSVLISSAFVDAVRKNRVTLLIADITDLNGKGKQAFEELQRIGSGSIPTVAVFSGENYAEPHLLDGPPEERKIVDALVAAGPSKPNTGESEEASK